jgi:hypothetical protein
LLLFDVILCNSSGSRSFARKEKAAEKRAALAAFRFQLLQYVLFLVTHSKLFAGFCSLAATRY